MTLTEVKSDVVILACAISAGIHGALAPDHFSESAGTGLAFVAATVALAGLALWLWARPASRVALATTAAVFLGLVASYAFAVTSGLPLLHPEPEAVDGLALATKAFEVVGLAAASSLVWRPTVVATPQPKGT